MENFVFGNECKKHWPNNNLACERCQKFWAPTSIVRPDIEQFLTTATDEQRVAIDEFISVLTMDGDSGSIHCALQACIEMSGFDYVLSCLDTIKWLNYGVLPVPTLRHKPLELASTAIAWLDANFGTFESGVGISLTLERLIDGGDNTIGYFILDKDGKRWRLSEILDAYAKYVKPAEPSAPSYIGSEEERLFLEKKALNAEPTKEVITSGPAMAILMLAQFVPENGLGMTPQQIALAIIDKINSASPSHSCTETTNPSHPANSRIPTAEEIKELPVDGVMYYRGSVIKRVAPHALRVDGDIKNYPQDAIDYAIYNSGIGSMSNCYKKYISALESLLAGSPCTNDL